MLARAERRSRQALKLVEKGKTRLAELDREGVAARQAQLFAEDQAEAGKCGRSQLMKVMQSEGGWQRGTRTPDLLPS